MTTVREPAVAGQFYAADADALREQVREALTHPVGPDDVPTVGTGSADLQGLVSPHAGLSYSGPVAAHGYAAVASRGRPDVVVIVGPNHTGRGDPVALSAADAWETPLGTVPVDTELRDAIVDDATLATRDERAHRREHSIEVQLPFLQYFYERPPAIVPVVMGRQDREAAMALGETLATAAGHRDETVLFVASTDLSHYEPPSVAERQDEHALDRIEALDPTGLLDVVEREGISMCGYGPTAAVLHAARGRGASAGQTLRYATSGDVAGPSDEVVGYCSATLA